MHEIEVSDRVALTEDLPTDGLKRGLVGTIIEKLTKDVFRVEFRDSSGGFFTTIVYAGQMMKLYLPQKMRRDADCA